MTDAKPPLAKPDPRSQTDETGHVLWIAGALQAYPMDERRAGQLAAELSAMQAFVRQQARTLAFEDEPSTYRATQHRTSVLDVD